MTRRLVLPSLLIASLLVAAVGAFARAAVIPPDAARLGADVETLAAPEMEGRRSGTAGGDRAARQIAEWLTAAGLRPGGDAGSFIQTFVLETSQRPGPGSSLELSGPTPRRLELGRDWIPHGGSLAGEVTADVVFVGYGADLPDSGYDDYAGVDVRGKVALALDGAPLHLAGARVSRLDKLIAAKRRGAVALLLAGTELPSPDTTAVRVGLVSGAGTRARIRVDIVSDEVRGMNVVGILPGADPALADEAVVIGAHCDHLGRVDGVIHPGADDNASGTAVAVGLARAFAAAGGMGRTLVVALFGAEELGLIG